MVKIFFPAFGVGFSELCKLALPFCHNTVNKIIEGKWSLVWTSLLHIIVPFSHPLIKNSPLLFPNSS